MLRFFVAGAFCASLFSGAFAQGWAGYGGNAQHTAQFTGASQTVNKIHWQVKMDDDPGYYNGVVFAHFASPMVSPLNTVVYCERTTTTVNNQQDFDNWNMIGVSAGTGTQSFYFHTDYSAEIVWPSDWTTILPMTLVTLSNTAVVHSGFGPAKRIKVQSTGAAVGGAGGSIFVRSSVDTAYSTTNRYIFYTTLQDFNANFSTYSSAIKICTPLTSDPYGNVYFGYEVIGTVPSTLGLGTGGVVKVNALNGLAIFQSVQSLNVDSSISRPAFNAAPVLSNDLTTMYVALTGSNGGFLAKLSTTTLNPVASVHMMDPTVPGSPAQLINESSASPMVAPDGHVFMGVFRNNWGESHGILLQYDQNLKATNSAGKTFPPGAFGWDDTPSVVPASIVPSYKGAASYLLLCKYNNYDDQSSDPGADGSNKVAVLDPTSDSISKDRQSGIPVMNEILTVLGPTLTNDDSSHPNARREWCINSAAVDIPKKSAIINSEDGHVYRWSFVSNTLTEGLNLQPPTSEAYTSTVIGPDGTIYAMNNTLLFAIGY